MLGRFVKDHIDFYPILIDLAKSKNIWERRISIISTFEFIKNEVFKPTFEISDMLMDDKEDLV